MIRVSDDFYQKLGLSDFASIEEIKKAYRRLVLIHHPDRGGSLEKMKELNHIYDILTKHKEEYDSWLRRNKYRSSVFVQVIYNYGWGFADNSTNSWTYSTSNNW